MSLENNVWNFHSHFLLIHTRILFGLKSFIHASNRVLSKYYVHCVILTLTLHMKQTPSAWKVQDNPN